MVEIGKFVYNRLYMKSKNLNYKGVKVNSFGIPQFISKRNLKIENCNRESSIYYNSFLSNLEDDLPKNMIVMYDIPSDKRRERDWFRRHLKKFGYIMIQKSVWVGPSPLPKDFIEYVRSLGLGDKLKTFKLARPYTGKENRF
jgi:hypothetical protein